jgi:endonuclease/exonuclease/phosphatase family metal-dependent hydrolase
MARPQFTFGLFRCQALFGLLGLATSACATAGPATKAPPAVHLANSPALTVGTYNCFVGTRDPRQTVAVIRKMHADVIALQEVTPERAAVLSERLAPFYRYRAFEGGLGLVSRYPLRKVRFERSSRGLNGFLLAEINFHHRRLQLVNVHLDPLRTWTLSSRLALPLQLWRQPAIHRAELQQVFAYLTPHLPITLMGDFNRATDGAIDDLRSRGYIDSFAAVTAHADRVPTLHYSMMGMSAGKRVDFIFHDRSFRTNASKVIKGEPSDHDAVVSVLSLPKGNCRRATTR